MRGVVSILVAGGLAGVVGAGVMATGVMATSVPSVWRRPAPVAATPQVATPQVATPQAAPSAADSDADRRQRLNARLQAMVRDGSGARLTETAPRPVARAAAPQARRSEASAVSRADARRPAARGYAAPRLDLTTPPVIPASDLECLTQAVYHEARSESEKGQTAVAEVVMNRSRHGAYPKSVCAVVYQRNSRTCQFTFTCDGSLNRGRINPAAWARAERIARAVHEGRAAPVLPANSVNYHADYVRPSWGQRLARVQQIGAHIFYGAPLSGVTPGAGEAVAGSRRDTLRDASRQGGLMFVRNEALDRAYALMTAGQAAAEAAD